MIGIGFIDAARFIRDSGLPRLNKNRASMAISKQTITQSSHIDLNTSPAEGERENRLRVLWLSRLSLGFLRGLLKQPLNFLPRQVVRQRFLTAEGGFDDRALLLLER